MQFNIKKQKHFFNFLHTYKNFFDERKFLLFLDYDGTLTPIASTPEKAFLSPSTRRILEALGQSPQCKVTVVSGRALKDLRKMINLKRLAYVGNHGFEASGPGIFFESDCFPQARKIFQRVINKTNERLRGVPGVLIEDKGVTLSIHYRLVDEKKQPWVKKAVWHIAEPFVVSKEIKAFKGKKVYELRPPVDWDKGKIVSWFIKEYKRDPAWKDALVIYIGDDRTDEDAFEALASKAVTICVGDGRKSKAQYYVEDTKKVSEVLSMILSSLKREQ